ncbi:SHOCT domain-containing protein [Streptomyces nojiriensis]|uniref:SHOCT domain-containing protein n=1 Tax=Streptomyces nojiriensis TaxID=66374 RepID=UPI003646CD0C
MFIRPMGVTVRAANRPPGHPLLRGLLARASGAAEPTAGSVGATGPTIADAPAGPAEPPPEVPPEFPQPAEPGPGAAVPPDLTAAAGLVAELTQLAGLAREGLLTPQEFTTAKARLLRG